MDSDLYFDGKKYISAKKASKLSGYSADYVGQLCRSKKISNHRVGKVWYVSEESLVKHISHISTNLNHKKHLNTVSKNISASSAAGVLIKRNLQKARLAKFFSKGVRAVNHQFYKYYPYVTNYFVDRTKNPKFLVYESLAKKVLVGTFVFLLAFSFANASQSLNVFAENTLRTVIDTPSKTYTALKDISDVYAQNLDTTYISFGTCLQDIPSCGEGILSNMSTIHNNLSAAVAFQSSVVSLRNPIDTAGVAVYEYFHGLFNPTTDIIVTNNYIYPKATSTVQTTPTKVAPTIIQNITQVTKTPITPNISTANLVSQAQLATALQNISDTFNNRLDSFSVAQTTGSGGNIQNVYQEIATSQNIDTLSGTTISNPTITGGSITGTSISAGSLSATSLSVSGSVSLGTSTIADLFIATSTPGCLQVSDTGEVFSTDADCGTGGGGGSGTPGGSNTQIQFNDHGGFGGAVGVVWDKINSVLSVPNIVVTGNATTTNATSTNLAITSITSSLLKTNSLGSIVPAIPGTDYLADTSGDWTGTFGTHLPAYYLNAINLTNFGTPFYTFFSATTTDALTQGSVNKYFSNALARAAISSSATGISYDNTTGILSLSSGYIIPLSASTTNWDSFFNTPSSRITAGTGLSWSGNTLNASGGSSNFGQGWEIINGYLAPTTTITVNLNRGYLSIGSSTIVGNATTTGSQSVGSLFLNNSLFTSLLGTGLTDSGGALTVSGVPLTSLATLPANSIVTTNASGNLIATGTQLTVGNLLSTTSAASSFAGSLGIGTTSPFAQLSIASTAGLTPFVLGSSTKTLLSISQYGGITQNISSSTAVSIQDGSGNPVFTVDTTQASTNSGLDITAGASQTGNLLNLYSSGGTFLDRYTSDGGFIQNVASTSAFRVQNGSASTIFSINSTTGTTTLAGLNVTASATSTSNVGFNLSTGCFAVNGTCIGGTSGSLTTLGSGFASTTQSAVTFSTTTTTVNGQTFGLTVVPTAGSLTLTPTITGTLNNSGLTNSTISGIALGGSLANLTATNGTLTFSGSYNGGTAQTVGLNLANANTWSALQQFNGNASTTGFSANYASFGGTATSSFSNTGALTLASALTVSNGGTGTTTQVTNGVNYYDGTKITSGTKLTFNGTGLGIGTSTGTALLTLQGTASASNLFSVAASSTGANLLTVSQWGGFTQNIASTTALNIQDGSGNSVLAVDTTESSTGSGIDITANSSQTANLLNLYSSAGSFLSGFTSDGSYLENVASTSAFAIQNGSGTNVLTVNTVSGTTTLAGLKISASATSTSNVGLNLSTGCFAVNGTCIGGGFASYDAFTHPAYGGAATTSLLTLSGGYLSIGSSTIVGNATTTGSQSVGSLFLNNSLFTSLLGSGLSNSGGALTVGTAGVLQMANGGTGITSYSPGDILYADGSGILQKLPRSTDGLVLKLNGGFPSWQTDLTSGGGGGATAWSTSTNSMIIYPTNTTNILVVGSNATTTTGNIMEVNGNALFDDNVKVAGVLSSAYSSSTAYSSFVTASTTDLIAGNVTLSTTTAGCLGVSSTGQVYALTCSTGSLTSYDAFTHPSAGQSATTSLMVLNGNASTTQLTVSGNSYLNQATTTNLAITNITSHLLKTDANGNVLAAVAGTDYQAAGNYDTFAFPWTVNTGYNSTSTTLGLTGGLFSTASSTISGAFHLSALANGELAVYGGLVTSGATTTAGTGLTYSGNAFSLNLSNPNTWTGLQSFNYSSSTIYSSFVTASTTNLLINGSSFNNLLGTGLTDSGGALTVSNVPLTSLSALPANSVVTTNASGNLIATGTQLTVGNLIATTTATSTFAGGVQSNLLNVTSTIATSTFANGIQINGGCVTVGGVCLTSNTGTLTSIIAGAGLTGGTITTSGTIALDLTHSNTFSALQSFNYASVTSYASFASASSTFENIGTLTLPNLTSGELAVDANGKVYKGATTTAGTGLSYSGNAFNVNTSQNITTLSNLTSNGFVKTSGSNGTLSIDTNTYLTGNQTVTLTGAVTGSGATAITTSFGTAGANTILANNTGATAVPTFISTSSLFAGTAGQVLAFSGGNIIGVATTTFSGGLTYSNGNVTNSGVTSIVAGTNITTSGSTGAVTINGLAFDFTPNATGFFNQAANATTTQIHFGATGVSLSASSTSQFDNSSTTFATIANTLWLPNLTSGELAVDANGKVYKGATTTAGTGLTYSGNAFSLNLSNPNTWTGLQSFNYSSSTIYSSFVTASTTNLLINGSSFNNLLGTGLTDSGGALTVSNVPLTSLSALPANSVVTTNASGNLIATGTQLTVGNILATTTATSTLPTLLTTNATTSSLAITNITSHLLKTDANGNVLAAVAGTDYQAAGNYDTFAFPWTVNTGYNSTSTTLGLTGGLFSTASSTISGAFHLSALANGELAVYGGLVTSGATTTAGTGLSYSGNAFNVNTSQNITTLSNLTSNGFVKTSGSNGTLSIDTNTYLTGNQTVTLTGAVTGSGATAITTSFGTAGANTILANNTGATAVPTFISTSSLFAGTAGQVLAFSGGNIIGVATTTFSGGLTYSNGNVTNSGVTSIVAGTNITTSGSTGAVTINGLAFDFTPNATGFFNQAANATTTQIHFGATGVSLSASSTSQFDNSSTTFATIANTLWLPNLTSGELAVDANGKVYKGATTTAGTGLTYSGNAFSLNLSNPNTWTGLQSFNYSSSTIYSSFVTASTTNLLAGNITLSTTTAGCLNVSGTGVVYSATCGAGALTSYDAFTHPFAASSATTSTLYVTGGFDSTASSTISSTFNLPALTNGALAVYGGLVTSGATTTAGTGLSYSGNAFNVNTSQNITTLSNLTSNGFVKTSGSTGALSIDTNSYQLAGTYLTTLGSGFASTTQSAVTFSTTTTTVNGQTFGLTVVPTAGSLTLTPTITGTLNNSGLTNSTISGIALGGSLANLTATNGTLTFSGSYNGGTAQTVGLNLANANTWSALQQFNGNASTTQLTSTGNTYLATTGGSVGVGTTSPSAALAVNGGIFTTASSTFMSGINLTGGCFAVGGTCLTSFINTVANGGTGSTSFAPNSIITSSADGTALIATGTQLTVGNLVATTSAVSSFVGNVGIGTSNPQNKLDVSGSLALGSYAGVNTAPSNSLIVSGNVGIGVTSPTEPLSIAGAGGGSFGTLPSLVDLDIPNDTSWNEVFTNDTAGPGDWMANFVDNSGNFYVGNSTDNFTLQVGQNGKVGVGFTASNLTTPVSTLDVAGNLSLGSYAGLKVAPANGVIISGSVGIGTSTPASQYQLTLASSTVPQLALSAGAGITQFAFRNAGGNLYISTTTVIGTATTSTAAFTISGTGFGTTTVTGLNINGQATTTSNVGVNITNGCYAIGGTCLSTGVSSVTNADGSLTISPTAGAVVASLNLTHSNTFSALQSFNYSSSTIYSSFVTASTTNLLINGSSFNNLLGTGLTDSGGALTVSNVPLTSLSALPANSVVTTNASGNLIATGTQLTVGNILATTTATSTLPTLLTTNATTSSLAITNITSHLLKTDANGNVLAAVAGTDYQAAGNYDTFAFPWTVNTGYNSTSTTLGLTGGLFSTASSTISGAFHLSALANGELAVYGGLVTSGATTTAGTGLSYSGNAFNLNTSQNIATLSNLTSNGLIYTTGGAGTLNTTATSTLAVGSSLLSSGTLGYQIGGTASTLSLNLTNPNTWSALQQFANSSSTQLSAYTASFGSTATSTFTSAGFLGIGTTSPFAQLSIASTAGLTPFVLGSSTKTLLSISQFGGITQNISSSTALSIQDGSGNPVFTVDTTQASTNSGIQITAGASQVGNLVSLQSSGGTYLSGFTSDGSYLENVSSTSALRVQNGSGTNILAVNTVTGTTTLTGLNITGSATTTSSIGFNITNGCYAIGGTCLSTGVSSVTNADGSLTISPTAGAVVASLNLTHSNTFSALQSFNYSSSTIYSSFVTASTTNLLINGSSFNNLLGTGLADTSGTLNVSNLPFSSLAALAINSIVTTNASGNLIATGTQLTVGNLLSTTSAASSFAGSLGIGTTSPFAQLSIASTAGLTPFVLGSSTKTLLSISQYGGITQNISSSTAVSIQDGSGNPVFTVDTTQASTNSGLDITAGASQTGNLLNLYSSGGTFLDRYTSDGGFIQNVASTSAFRVQNGSASTIFSINSTTGTTTLAGLNVTGSATTTSSIGFNITNGCYAVGGTCLSTGVSSVTNSDGTLTISPTAGAVVASLNLGHANTFSALQTFNYSSSTAYSSFVTASTTNLIAGNITLATSTAGCLNVSGSGLVYSATCTSGGSGTVSSGLQGQLPFYNANGTTLTATSTIFLTQAGNIGIGTTTPASLITLQGTANPNDLFTITASSTGANLLTVSQWGGFTQNIASTTALNIQDGSGNSVLAVDTTESSTGSGIDITANSSQTANLLNLYSSAGSFLSGFTSDGSYLENVASTSAFTVQNGSAANVLTVNTLSSEIGIGTATPAFLLDLATTTGPQISLNGTNTDAPWTFRSIGSTLYIATSSPTTFATSTLAALTINSTGNVGVGTSTAFAQLSVNSVGGQAAFAVGSSTKTSLIVDQFGNVGVATSSALYALDAYSSTASQLALSAGAGIAQWAFRNAGGNFYLGTTTVAGSATSSVAALTIQNLGNVGISSSTPFAQLSVNSYPGQAAFAVGSSTKTSLIVDQFGNVGVATSSALYALNPYSTTASQLALSNGAGIAQWAFRNAGGNFYLGTTTVAGSATSSVAALTIQNLGNIGISSSTPFGQLSVNSYAGQAAFVIGSSTGTSFIVDKLGDVGIGTAAPTTAFQISKAAAITADFNDTAGSELQIALGSNSTIETINSTTLTLGTHSGSAIIIDASENVGIASGTPWALLSVNPTGLVAGQPQFAVGSSTGTNLIVSNAGFVGIATTSPQARLSVNPLAGDVTAFAVGSSTKSLLSVSAQGFGTTTLAGLNVNATATSTSNVGYNITTGCYAIGGTCLGGSSSQWTNISGGINYSGGTVGIGTSSPESALAVVGSITASSLQSNPNGVVYVDSTGQLLNTGTGGAGTLCLTSASGGTPTWGSCAGSASTQWSNLSAPGANLSLAMGADTSTFTWNDTSVNNLFVLKDTSGNTGTGYLFQVSTQNAKRNPFDIQANGVDALMVAASGSVGVGTTTPFGSLDIASTTAQQLVLSGAATDAPWTFRSIGGSLYIGTSSPTTFATSTLAALTINSNGNIGVGSTTPSSPFSLEGNAYFDSSSIIFGSSTIATGATTTLKFVATTTILIGNNNQSAFSIGTSTTQIGGIGGAGSIFNIASVGATTTIGFFTSTTTGLYAGSGVPLAKQNMIIFGDGTATTSLAVVKGSLCLDMDGWCTAATSTPGRLSARSTNVANSDLAEMYDSNDTLQAGDVVVSGGPAGYVEMASSTTDVGDVLGVVSTDPGVTLGSGPDYDGGGYPVALAGRVPVKATLDNGPIKAGDFLTLSTTTPGSATKAITSGYVIGQALADYDPSQGTVLMFVKNTYYIGSTTLSMEDITGDLGALASSTASSTPASGSFATAFFNNIFAHITAWLADATNGIGNLFAKQVNTQQLCVSDSSGAKTCLDKAQLDALIANVGSGNSNSNSNSNNSNTGGDIDASSTPATNGNSGDNTATTTPPVDTTTPVVTVVGNNPATITVGSTYNDLGATETDTDALGNPDNNLDITASVNGATSTPIANISLDTSTSTTYTIIYSATDAAGNTGSAQRVVNVVSAQ